MAIDVGEIRNKIKEIIAEVTSLDPGEIADGASFVEDLQLDSLSLLQIGVDVDYEFKLDVPEERLQELRTLQESVDLVVTTLGPRSPAAVPA
ncbi:MAG: phosphopantetheine-binding protein [Acidobacteriota bacterium]